MAINTKKAAAALALFLSLAAWGCKDGLEELKSAGAEVQSVTVTPAAVFVTTGGSVQLKAIVSPEDASQKVRWSAEGPATVDQSGLVSAGEEAGTAYITAASAVDERKAGEAVITVIPVYSGEERVIERVVILGTAKAGAELTAAAIKGVSEVEGVSWRWFIAAERDGEYREIAGETSHIYTPKDADVGAYLKAEASKDGFSLESEETGAVLAADAQSGPADFDAVEIDGIAAVGSTMRAVVKKDGEEIREGLQYQWKIGSSPKVANFKAIPGANESEYTPSEYRLYTYYAVTAWKNTTTRSSIAVGRLISAAELLVNALGGSSFASISPDDSTVTLLKDASLSGAAITVPSGITLAVGKHTLALGGLLQLTTGASLSVEEGSKITSPYFEYTPGGSCSIGGKYAVSLDGNAADTRIFAMFCAEKTDSLSLLDGVWEIPEGETVSAEGALVITGEASVTACGTLELAGGVEGFEKISVTGTGGVTAAGTDVMIGNITGGEISVTKSGGVYTVFSEGSTFGFESGEEFTLNSERTLEVVNPASAGTLNLRIERDWVPSPVFTGAAGEYFTAGEGFTVYFSFAEDAVSGAASFINALLDDDLTDAASAAGVAKAVFDGEQWILYGAADAVVEPPRSDTLIVRSTLTLTTKIDSASEFAGYTYIATKKAGVVKLNGSDNAAIFQSLIAKQSPSMDLKIDVNGKSAITAMTTIKNTSGGTLTILDSSETKGVQSGGILFWPNTGKSLVISGLHFVFASATPFYRPTGLVDATALNFGYVAIAYAGSGSCVVTNTAIDFGIAGVVWMENTPLLGIASANYPSSVTVSNTSVIYHSNQVSMVADSGLGAKGLYLDAPLVTIRDVTVDTSNTVFGSDPWLPSSPNDSSVCINLYRVSDLGNISVSGLSAAAHSDRPNVEFIYAKAAGTSLVVGESWPSSGGITPESAFTQKGAALFNSLPGAAASFNTWFYEGQFSVLHRFTLSDGVWTAY